MNQDIFSQMIAYTGVRVVLARIFACRGRKDCCLLTHSCIRTRVHNSWSLQKRCFAKECTYIQAYVAHTHTHARAKRKHSIEERIHNNSYRATHIPKTPALVTNGWPMNEHMEHEQGGLLFDAMQVWCTYICVENKRGRPRLLARIYECTRAHM